MLYNTSQQKVIDAESEKMLVIAPPGAGKTATLVGAIEKYHHEHPTHHITAITFTKKATAELQSRIKIMGISISTIHSWAFSKLREMSAQYGFKVQLLEEDIIKEILKRLCNNRKQYYLNQYLLFSFVMGNYNVDVDEKIKRTFELIRHDYVKFKARNQLYDFTDLPKYLLDKLEEFGLTITDTQALFVDEFQDIDPVQYDVFNLVEASKKFYIADPNQSIYQFRGSLEEVIEKLDDFDAFKLTTNYRSYQEILDFAEEFRKMATYEIAGNNRKFSTLDIDSWDYCDIECERGSGAQIYRIAEMGECESLVDGRHYNDTLLIRRLLEDPKTQILCRSNKQVKKLQSMNIVNVSTVHQAKGLEYDNVVLVDFPITSTEERNIAYVAITRAKNQLCLIDFDVLLYFSATNKIEQSGGKLF